LSNYIFFSFAFILIVLFLWVLFFIGKYYANKTFKNKVLVSLVFYFISIKLLLHYTIPAILRIKSGYYFEQEDNVELSYLLIIYIIELFSWLFWFLGFLSIGYFFKEKFDCITKQNFITMNSRQSNSIFVIISIGFIVQLYHLISLTTGSTIFVLFSQLFYFSGLTVGPLLIIGFGKVFNFKYLILGIIVFTASLFSLATRGAMIYSFCYILFLIFYLFYSKKIIIRFFIILISISFLFITFPNLFGGRVSINENGVNFVTQDFGEKQQGRTFLNEVEWRLGAPTRIGTAFIQLYDETPAGINPIKNSLLGFLPRSINESKPYPSTLDGNNEFSLGMYLICKKIYGTESLMVEFPTGAHFYWEFGIFGIVILSFISGIYIAAFVKFWSRIGLIAIPLIITLFKPFGYMDPKIWVSDIAMQLYQIIIPVLFILFVYKYILIIFNLINVNQFKK
jgi:hypothetical protein